MCFVGYHGPLCDLRHSSLHRSRRKHTSSHEFWHHFVLQKNPFCISRICCLLITFSEYNCAKRLCIIPIFVFRVPWAPPKDVQSTSFSRGHTKSTVSTRLAYDLFLPQTSSIPNPFVASSCTSSHCPRAIASRLHRLCILVLVPSSSLGLWLEWGFRHLSPHRRPISLHRYHLSPVKMVSVALRESLLQHEREAVV